MRSQAEAGDHLLPSDFPRDDPPSKLHRRRLTHRPELCAVLSCRRLPGILSRRAAPAAWIDHQPKLNSELQPQHQPNRTVRLVKTLKHEEACSTRRRENVSDADLLRPVRLS